jgi:hypothetical protein
MTVVLSIAILDSRRARWKPYSPAYRWGYPMGKMTIAIDLQVGGKAYKSDIEWQNGDLEIRSVIDFIDRMADQDGITPEALTHSTLRFMTSMGWRSDPNDYEVQKMAVLYTVLQWPMPDRPGAIYNYTASEDIEATLMVRDASVTVHVKGK